MNSQPLAGMLVDTATCSPVRVICRPLATDRPLSPENLLHTGRAMPALVVPLSIESCTHAMPQLAPVSADCNTLRFLPLRMQCRSIDLELSGLTGPLWRSGFGAALQSSFPGIFDLLFADQARLGRLYALQPAIGAIQPGQIFELGLNLFGEATEHALACAQTIATLGNIGLGTPRGHFVLERAWVQGEQDFMHHSKGLLYWPQPHQIACWDYSNQPISHVQVTFQTPLRIKDGNDVCAMAPDFPQLIRRLQGRLAQLCEAAGEENPLSRELAAHQLENAHAITPGIASVHWANVQRRSSRTGQTMKFGGLLGSSSFSGDLTPHATLLALGNIMQLGGKTTFGFGCLRNTFSFED